MESKVVYLTRNEGEKLLHLSHIFKYISAYHFSTEQFALLVADIEKALQIAKETTSTQIVDQDGEFCLHITPMGYITIMIPWKTYRVAKENK
jgi:hypothetical protein